MSPFSLTVRQDGVTIRFAVKSFWAVSFSVVFSCIKLTSKILKQWSHFEGLGRTIFWIFCANHLGISFTPCEGSCWFKLLHCIQPWRLQPKIPGLSEMVQTMIMTERLGFTKQKLHKAQMFFKSQTFTNVSAEAFLNSSTSNQNILIKRYCWLKSIFFHLGMLLNFFF